ncbi:MAG: MOSC domain-containing protein [Burkholderiaceae bacterium]|nr:MOSC domain-containing protein [Burkholderiaceae bacterium]
MTCVVDVEQAVTSSTCQLLSVNLGQARPLMAGGRKILSAIGKQAVEGSVAVNRLGLDGDEQVELSIHGGIDKAVYAYPVEHHAFWQKQRQSHGVSLFEAVLPPGFVGENLSISGLLEHEVWVGDELHFPDCVLRVTAPREPCFKFNAVMGYNQAAKDMALAGCCGFYLAVDQTGSMQAGQTCHLVPGRRSLSITQAFAAKWAKHAR